MAKDPAIYLTDILDAIRRIESYTKGMTAKTFVRDERAQDAVIRCLEILSEASRRLPDDMKASQPNIPWVQIAGIGNILRHDYGKVSADAIWDVVENHVSPLKLAINYIRESRN